MLLGPGLDRCPRAVSCFVQPHTGHSASEMTTSPVSGNGTNGNGACRRAIRRDDWFLAWLAIAFGSIIIICHIESGASRWAAAAWHYAVRVPGSPATWGVTILIAGAALLYGNFRRKPRCAMLGYGLAFLWFCVLSSAATWAMIDDINTGTRLANPLSLIVWPAFAYLYQARIRGAATRTCQ